MSARKAVAVGAAALTASMAVTATATAADGAATTVSHQLAFSAETSAFGSALSRTSCDVNGDQVDDVVVGDRGWERGEYGQVGAAYVLLGGTDVTGGDATEPSAAGAVRLDGPPVEVPAGAWLGWSVSCLGDANGDGIDDLVVGTGSRAYHSVAVVFGSRDFGPLDLSDLGTRGYTITDPVAGTTAGGGTDNFGYAVTGPGDVDGDGLADVAIGDLLADNNGRTNSGRVWVVKGKASTTPVDVQTDTEQVLAVIDGGKAEERLATVEAAGDVNGDGKDDLLLGSYVATPWAGTTGNGAGYVVYGGGPAVVDVGALAGRGFMVAGPTRGKDRLGVAAGGIGDIDGDGQADFVLGADGATGAGIHGGVAVVLGSDSDAPVMTDPLAADGPAVYSCADGALDATCADSSKVRRGYWVQGASAEAHTGFSVAGMPDANGDAVPDFLLGAYGEGSTGAAYLIYSEPERVATLSLADLTAAQGERFTSETGTGTSGRTVGAAGDVDGNGVQDVAFGGQGNNVTVALRGALSTKVTVTAGEQRVTGEPVAFDVSVRPSTGVRNAAVDGVATVSVDGAPVADLQQVPVTDGVAAFEWVGGPGSHQVTVGFVPADAARLKPTTASTQVVVGKQTATGELTLDADTAEHGTEVTARFTTAATLARPVSFEVDGVAVAAAAVVDGVATAKLDGLAVGRRQVRVSYPGDDVVSAFSTAPASLTVSAKAAQPIAVTLSSARVVYGRAVQAQVTVAGGHAVHGGKVAFYADHKLAATVAVGHDGVARARIAGLKAGRHRITARFLGSAETAAGATSPAVAVAVAKARPGRVVVKGAAFRKGTRPKVTVRVGTLDNGARPVGTVVVRAGGKSVKVKLTAAKKGKVVVRLPKAKKAVTVRATFVPKEKANVARATSAKVKLKPRR
ncbi:FG-GAP repeat protein [Nocardioides sp. zg-ZUI104]|uniref:Ig-like domain repeat protein n=1 Tax=Nocardioides faecalis TaxID=2803858 RepID=UPI001BD06E92|nr:Ig-like domain repeat protein [Nocardioides faecalis]MBS4752702.1 FG-GAP repeat protein [Nocardioides faecalis]